MKTYELFPTSIVEFDFSNHYSEKNILKIINDTKVSHHPTLDKGLSSFYNKNILDHDDLIDLKWDIQKCIDKYCNYLGIQKCVINNSWFNIMEEGGKTGFHYHGSCIVSGAYYPFLEENTCNLIFRNPAYASLNFLPPFIENSNITERKEGSFKNYQTINLKKGFLYLFPSWLEHGTEVNTVKQRLVISFNAELKV